MHLSNVIRSHQARQNAGAFYGYMVVKQLHLYVRAQDAVVPVTNRVHAYLGPAKLRVLLVCAESSIWPQICMFLDLRLHKGQHIVCQLQYRAGENLILHHVHLRSHLGFRAVIADNPNLRPLEEPLRILSEQQHGSPRQRLILSPSVVLLLHHIAILAQIRLMPLPIAYYLHVILHQRHIQVFPSCVIHRRILVVMFTLGIHQLHPLLEVQLL